MRPMAFLPDIIGTQRKARGRFSSAAAEPADSAAAEPPSSREIPSSMTWRTISRLMWTGCSGPSKRSQATCERISYAVFCLKKKNNKEIFEFVAPKSLQEYRIGVFGARGSHLITTVRQLDAARRAQAAR